MDDWDALGRPGFPLACLDLPEVDPNPACAGKVEPKTIMEHCQNAREFRQEHATMALQLQKEKWELAQRERGLQY